MGYVAKTVSAASVKKGFFESAIFHITQLRVAAAAYEEIYNSTIDFSDVNYLDFRWETHTSGNYLRVHIGGVQRFESHPAAGWVEQNIDCTAITGEQALLIETMQDTGANTFDYLTIIARE